MTGDTASAVASEPDVLEAVLMERGYNYGTSENPNDSQTNHRETSSPCNFSPLSSCLYEQETYMSQNQVHEKYDNGENYSWGYIEGFWTDGNDSQETGSSVSNAMDSGASYVDTVTHFQAETFQMPKAVDSASLYDGLTASDTNRHSHPSDTYVYSCEYGSTCASQSVVVNS